MEIWKFDEEYNIHTEWPVALILCLLVCVLFCGLYVIVVCIL